MLFMAGVALLAIVLIPDIGKDVNGARRWLPLGIVNLQPSELMKLFAVLAARAVAHWDRVPAEVTAALQSLITEMGERTVGDLIDADHTAHAWRPLLTAELTHHLARLFAADGFVAWLTDLVEGPASG